MCSDKPLTSVIIATYNRGSFLLETLEYVMQNDYPRFEVIVVDQTAEYPAHIQAELNTMIERYAISYIKLSAPSLTVARNVGIAHSSGEIIIFCDDDVKTNSDYITNHVSCYKDDQVGAVAGRVISRIDNLMADPSGQIGRLLPDGSFTANFHLAEPTEVDFGMGCNMSFRRSALIRAGCFDERYIGSFYREEGDAFARVKHLGYRIVFEPSTILEHLAAPEGGCRKDVHLPRMYSTFHNETLFYLNCMKRRNLHKFLLRLVRWMYATVKSNGYSLREFLYFFHAIFAGLRTYLFKQSHYISGHILDRPLTHEIK